MPDASSTSSEDAHLLGGQQAPDDKAMRLMCILLMHCCDKAVMTGMILSALQMCHFALFADMHRLPVSIRSGSGSQQDQAGGPPAGVHAHPEP